MEEFFVEDVLHLNLGSTILGSSLKMVNFYSNRGLVRVFMKENRDGTISIRDTNDESEKDFGYVHL